MIARRRLLFVTLALALCLSSIETPAQQRAELPRIGFLSVEATELSLEPFREGLRQLGYVEGRNIALEIRSVPGQQGKLHELAAELVRLDVRIIVAGGSDAIGAAQQATKTIPIVMTQASDAVGSGFVVNLARPGGNITGVTSLLGELGAKRLELIKEIAPGITRVAVTWNGANPSHAPGLGVIQAAAQRLGIELYRVEVRTARGLDAAFSAFTKARAQALVVLPDHTFVRFREQVVHLAAQSRLPVVYWRKEFVEAGGLISYGGDNPAEYRRAAYYVDRILKGTKPGDLAVEQINKFELVINLKAAKALGITIPQSLLVRADEVIQ